VGAGDVQWGTVTDAITATVTFVAVTVAIVLPIREQRLSLLKQESDGLDDVIRMLSAIRASYVPNQHLIIDGVTGGTLEHALRRHHGELLTEDDRLHIDYMKGGAHLGQSDIDWIEALIVRLNDRRDFCEKERSRRWPRRSALPDRHRPEA
jgi:hypothetical protein